MAVPPDEPASTSIGAPSPSANPFAERLVQVALLLAAGMLPLAPHQQNPVYPALLGALLLLLLASPSLWLSWAALLAGSVALRWTGDWQPWFDQTFVQLASLSALLSGHGIYYLENLMRATWSVYLPMGDLLAAFPILVLGKDFSQFFQILVPILYALPFLVAPSRANLRLFIGLAFFFPFLDYTGKGGNLEIAAATQFAGLWLAAQGRRLGLAGGLLGYAALIRQPLLVSVPFSALALWRQGSRRGLAGLASVLLAGGAFHVLRNPFGFVHATLGVWPDFAEQWFHKSGIVGNYSLSTLLVELGFEGAADRESAPFYFAALAAASVALLALAWRRREPRAVLACGVGAVLAVHLLHRGFVHYHYLVGAALPALALIETPAGAESRRSQRLAGAFAGFATAALVGLVTAPILLAVRGELGDRPPRGSERPVVFYSFLDFKGKSRRLAPEKLVWSPAVSLSRPLEIGLAAPARVRELQLLGARLLPRPVDGVVMVTPGESEVLDFLLSGSIDGSLDGREWRTLASFRNLVHPSVYPIRIRWAEASPPVSYLRVRGRETWSGGGVWRFGGARVFGDAVE